ncbi:TssQ family T6SS-associated lipoprotein [Burkholderia ubonensis]|uniref:TssQ family T6SS-associated lipoprotein n=1 Tax=Burkholderia ubonensis TaxID=101571 RepID=UPI00075A361B|nr:TssQ family T6SS-associated lipoprotein [Burkholderia ubonensis]KVQ07028.1 type VI secretion protein [Burkholderia ubonensis]
MKGRPSLVVCLGLVLLGMSGCSSTSTSTSPTQTVARAAVDSARAAYAAGDYGRTIAILGRAREIDGADVDTQVAAHKLLAFSYCVTNRVATCRAEFSKILDLNPRFELSPAEKGHPIWGPAFETARRRHASAS